MDFDAIVGLLHENIIYHNIPVEPVIGRNAVAAYLQSVWRFDSVDWELVNIAADGNRVLTERVDAFIINGAPVSLPVMGVFEIEDGLISAWRDYFDMASYKDQLSKV